MFTTRFNGDCDVGCPTRTTHRRWLGILNVDDGDKPFVDNWLVFRLSATRAGKILGRSR